MNWIDLLVLVLLAVGIFRGFSTGIVRQVLGILGVVLAFALGLQLMTPVGSMLEAQAGIPEGFGPITAFILIFLILLLGARLASRVIESTLKLLRLSTVNRIAGGLFGAFQATLLLSLLFLVLLEIGLPSEQARAESQLFEPVAAVFPVAWDEAVGRWPRAKQVSEEFGARIEAELGSGSD